LKRNPQQLAQILLERRNKRRSLTAWARHGPGKRANKISYRPIALGLLPPEGISVALRQGDPSALNSGPHGNIRPSRSDEGAMVFREELLQFPAGKYDDQVDALSLIGQMLDRLAPGQPAEPEPELLDMTRPVYLHPNGRFSNTLTLEDLWQAEGR
jgi:hypothetical protein